MDGRRILEVVLAVVLLAACGGGSDVPCLNVSQTCPDPKPSFASDVRPIINARCLSCHSPGGQEAVRDYTTYAGVVAQRPPMLTQVYSCPAPPARGTDTWNIHVTDANGAALSNLTLTAKPFMPDHGHGPAVSPAVASNGDGNYTVTNLYFFMAGVWQVTLTAKESTDSAVFMFGVPGEPRGPSVPR